MKRLIIIFITVAFCIAASLAFALPEDLNDTLPEPDIPWDIPFDEPYVPDAGAQLLPEQLIINGDFSMGSSNWNTSSYKNDGTAYFNFEYGDAGMCAKISNSDYDDARFEQEVAVKPNTIYRIIAQVKANSIDSEAEKGANIGVLNIFPSSVSLFDAGEWQTLEFYGKTGSNQTSVTVVLRLGGYGSLAAGEAWFRNVEMNEAISAPSYAAVHDMAPVKSGGGQEPGAGTSVATLFLLSAAIAILLYKYVLGERKLAAQGGYYALVIFCAGILIRLVLAASTTGHPTDISCFCSWAVNAAKYGLSNFYTADFFSDYPPGYIYVLYVLGKVYALFQIDPYSHLGILIIKLPSIMADVGIAYMACRTMKSNKKVALTVAAVLLLNPVSILNSSIWGQVDSVLALALVTTFFLLNKKRMLWASLLYGLAVLIKPQALIVGPVFAAAFLLPLLKKETRPKGLANICFGAVIAAATIIIGTLPMKGTQNLFYFIEQYYTTATSYPYGSVNAFNLMCLLGGNWVQQTGRVIGAITYVQLGNALIVVSVLVTMWFAYAGYRKGRTSLFLLAAFLVSSVFMLGHNMHERYLFPAIIFLPIAYYELKDIRILKSFSFISAVFFLNVAAVLIETYKSNAHFEGTGKLTLGLFSLASLAAFAYLAYVCYSIFVRGEMYTSWEKPSARFIPEKPALSPNQKLSKFDFILMGSLTLVYAVVTFVGLGSTDAPQTSWKTNQPETIVVQFEHPVQIGTVWSYCGIGDGSLEILCYRGDVLIQQETLEADDDNMFRWNVLETSVSADKVYIQTTRDPWLYELGFKNADGDQIIPQYYSVESGNLEAAKLFDEQNTLPLRPTHMNGMYFDELYHGRTAFEHLYGFTPYENSHPPLGKVIIMLGISIFGMTPFGWRFSGTLCGVLMVPIMYIFGKRVFKKSEYAFLASFLMAFDFMHFTQTRIATIDTYAVLFILLMYYYMYKYYSADHDALGYKALIPLGLSGLFFGLGAASKWTCIFAGGGLAVLLFTSIAKRYFALSAGGLPQDEKVIAYRRLTKNTAVTLAFCVVTFIVIPVAIYIASYIPYMLCAERAYTLKDIWGLQEFMYSYHSRLTERHAFESAWWSWPLMLRPIWYRMGVLLPAGTSQNIIAFGNPAVWWTGSVAMVLLIVARTCGFLKEHKGVATFIIVGFMAQYLPWVTVTRATFIYHFFPSIPFLIFALVYLIAWMENKYGHYKWVHYIKWGIVLCAAVLFVMFYPIIEGTLVSKAYASSLAWFDGWSYFSG